MEKRIDRSATRLRAKTNARTSTRLCGRGIGELVLQIENEPLEATASRLAQALPVEDLPAIVADWLDTQLAI